MGSALEVAKILGAEMYIEISALDGEKVKEVFYDAVNVYFQRKKANERHVRQIIVTFIVLQF